MKKMLIMVTSAVLIGVSSLAQKASIFSHSGKAIRGYDPVAYFIEGKPVNGMDSLVYEWENARWYFASRKNLDLFKAAPGRYAPQYGGYCAYGLSNGYKASTDPQAWTIVNGKLYLNYNTAVRAEWNKDREQRIEKAGKNWPVIKDKE
ncbi:MAG TPA: YHS domain-containing (seleno)protein [Chitinophagaceae bacterium]|nr:YHS domain-containing (seleno)protein [Chitinophagaceae bacterium]